MTETSAQGKKKRLRSVLKQFISDDCYLDLFKVTLMNADNNTKIYEAKRVLQKHNVPFDGLGSGTNRFAVSIDGYSVKIAVDEDGMIDNLREFRYSMELYPYVIKCYEVAPSGLLMVCEYVNVFEQETFRRSKAEMRKILTAISKRYLLGDVGYSQKNYINWGTRQDGSICILDFAYIYDLTFKVFTCNCDGITMVQYDENFNNLRCPSCGRKYTFGDIRMKITRTQQQKEIGNVRKMGYVLTKPNDTVDYNEAFELVDTSKEDRIKSVESTADKLLRLADERDASLKHMEDEAGTEIDPDELSDAELEVYRAAGII